jgi:ribosomal-protein-alanine N-acetyltransferase
MSLQRMRWWHLEQVLDLEQPLFAPDDWPLETWLSELAQPGNDYCVDTGDTGGVRVQAMGGISVTPHGESYLQSIGVDPQLQGRGLGRRLFAALVARARQRGALSMGLEVRDGNLAAVAMYESAGFAPVGLRPGYYEHSGADALVMVCSDLEQAVVGPLVEVAW